MLDSKQPEMLTKIADTLSDKLIKIELLAAVLVLIGYVLISTGTETGSILFEFSLFPLSVAYFFKIYTKTENVYTKFVTRLTYMGCSIATTGVLFIGTGWPGGLIMYQIAILSLFVALLGFFVLGVLMRKMVNFKVKQIYRPIVILAMLLGVYFIPEYEIYKKLGDNIETIDYTNKKHFDENNFLSFDSITVMEFVELLPLKKNVTKNSNILIVIGQANSTWVTKNDIPKLIKMIDSEQPACCIERAIATTTLKSPVGEESTVGGQVMNLIDSYRFNKPFPFSLINCSVSEKERQKEILDWWAEKNK